MTWPRRRRWIALGFWILLACVAFFRMLGIFTENVNWDEFALLQRAVLTHSGDQLVAGGRPGLGTLVLVPFAAGCVNAVDAVVRARILWTGMFAASAVAFWYLLKDLLRPSPYRGLAALVGVSLWLMAPPVLRFSVQVRTDQPAILFGLLGALALLRSRYRVEWAALAGVLFGIGFLFSQKLLYLVALAGVLAVGQHLMESDWRLRREASRALLTAVALVGVLLAYRGIAGALVGIPSLLPVGGGLETFRDYREHVGWGHYTRLFSLLVPQVLIMGFLLVLTLNWARRRGEQGRAILVSWGVLLTGIAVAVFHAGRFPYFYMILGLFPACIGALITRPVLESYRGRLLRLGISTVIAASIVSLVAFQAVWFSVDSQRHQRESLEFVERNFRPDAPGFGTRAEFACRSDSDPFPVWFGEHVRAHFGGDDAHERARDLMDELRSKEVAFMVSPPVWDDFPEELREFWRTRYVAYFASIRVAGRQIQGNAEWSGSFEVIVPGRYVWRPFQDHSASSLRVDGESVLPLGSVELEGQREVELHLPHGGDGLFVLALDEPPSETHRNFFLGF